MCCGDQRKKYQNAPRRISLLPGATEPVRLSNVRFEYFGRTGLTVRGRASGKTYRFERPGFQIEADARDAASLKDVPNLRLAGPSR
jgi:hypothetical protein